MSFPLLQEYRCNSTLNGLNSGLNTCVSKDTLHLDLQPDSIPRPKYNRTQSLRIDQHHLDPTIFHVRLKKGLQMLKTSSSLMDLRNCGSDDAPKSASVQRQCSFSKKSAPFKLLSRHVSSESPNNPIEDHLSSISQQVSLNNTWKLQDIPSSYREIMDTNILSEEALDQQVAIWELIQTEHCFLSQLATIKNVFLYCLNSLKSADLLVTEGKNYFKIFGNIDQIYLAHLCFWKKTLLPSLQKSMLYHIPISLIDLVRRFPSCKELFFVHEEYCICHNTNLQELDKAMKNPEFKRYIKWCEARPECQRLHLKDFLAKPMQRVTKYPLLLKVIHKKAQNNDIKEQLTTIIEDMEQLVQAINLAMHHNEEIAKVKEVSKRITSYSMGDFPRGWEEFLHPYMQLDLMAPMAGVDHMHHRKLLLEGSLRYKDSFNKVETAVFLFTDILLIAKPVKKGTEQLSIYKPPFRVDQLLIKEGSNPACFNVLYLSELRIPILWFNLRAATPHTAAIWMKKIRQAQKQYFLLTNKNGVSIPNIHIPRCSNGSDTSLSLYSDEDTDSSPDSPQTDTVVPLVRISHCDEDDSVYEETRHRHHKPHIMFTLTPSCSSSSLANSVNSVNAATQTDSPPSG